MNGNQRFEHGQYAVENGARWKKYKPICMIHPIKLIPVKYFICRKCQMIEPDRSCPKAAGVPDSNVSLHLGN